MNYNKEQLKDVVFRVNAAYDNEKTVNILGSIKDMNTGEKSDIRGTIFKFKRDGNESLAYQAFKSNYIGKGDLLFTKGDGFKQWNGKDQFIIKQISKVNKNKFTEQQQSKPEPLDVPWELEL